MNIVKSTTNIFQNFISIINELWGENPPEKTNAIESEIKDNHIQEINQKDSQPDMALTNLKNDNLFLNEIIQYTEEGFLILDENQKIKFINKCLLRKNGIPGEPSDYIDRVALELLRFPFLYENIRTLFAQNKSSKTIRISCETTKTEFEALIKFITINNENLILIKWQDITLCSKTERAGKDLVANVAHQLRTPLTSIKGYAETLLDGAFDDPQVSKKFLETILRNADRLTNLVKDILTLAKLDDNNSLNLQLVNVSILVTYVVEQLSNIAEEKEVTINTHYPENDVFILGSLQDIEIAIHNLLDNAIKYTANKTALK